MKFHFGRDTDSTRLCEIEALLRNVEYSTDPPPDAHERDKIAIEYEDAFAGRFGFRRQRLGRIALIEAKNRCGATDSEIRKLYFTGNLKQRGNQIKINGDASNEIAGWAYIALLVALFGPLIVSQFWTPISPLSLALKTAVASLLLAGFCWCIYQLLIFPRRLQKRARESIS